MTRRRSVTDIPWVLALGPSEANADERAAVRASLPAIPAARVAVVLATCRRVEVIGFGAPPTPSELTITSGIEAAGRARAFIGRAAVERVLRIAAGLESTVIGEDQVLAQVRAVVASDDAAHLGAVDPRLRRLLETAIGVGRRARATRPLVERSLAEATIVVAGAGPIGAAAARAAAGHGARVVVASRDLGRARRVAAPIGATVRTLDDVAADLDGIDALVVALAGPWTALAAAVEPLPTIVDLSAPVAVPPTVVERLGARFADLDALAALADVSTREAASIDAYVAVAESLVEESTDRFLAWLAGRQAVGTLQELRSRVEARRVTEVDRLFRRQPSLDDRDRTLIEQLSQRLVAAVLHEPTRRLREDLDGHAADAARVLFALEPER